MYLDVHIVRYDTDTGIVTAGWGCGYHGGRQHELTKGGQPGPDQ
jgi:hypothetical protein